MIAKIAFLGTLLAAAPIASLSASYGDLSPDATAPLPSRASYSQEFTLIRKDLCRVRTLEADTGKELRIEFFRPKDEQFDYCRRSAAALLPADASGAAASMTAGGTASGLTATIVGVAVGTSAVVIGIAALDGRPKTERPRSR